MIDRDETTSTNMSTVATPSTAANAMASNISPIQGIHPPRPLDVKGNVADNWKTFNQAWQNYAIIMNITSQPEAYKVLYKVALFLHCIGPGAVKIFNGMSFENPDDSEKLECIINKFEEFTIGEINKTYERYVFNRRNRSPEESIDSCIATLRTLAQTCNFCECLRDTLIRDRILLGVCNPQTRK